MVMRLRLLLVLASLLASFSAHAVFQISGWEYQLGVGYAWTSWQGACDQWMQASADPSQVFEIRGAHPDTATSNRCRGDGYRKSNGDLTYPNTQSQDLNVRAAQSCPAHSQAVSGGCGCVAGFDEAGGQCVAHVNACTAKTGQASVVNWTQGYSRTPDEGDLQGVGGVTPPPSNGQICDGGCNVSAQLAGPGVQHYVSQEPNAQGLYRRAVDLPAINLGTECTPAQAPAPVKPTEADRPCPGTVGTVNGKTVCIGTAEKPVTSTPIDRPSEPPIAGNPAAGPKPASGEGSGSGSAGRTPGAGSGGSAGGPAAAGVGGRGGVGGGTGSGSGTVAAPASGQEQAACGAPGQAPCKIDESGTPDGVGDRFKTGEDAIEAEKQKMADHRQTISGSSDKGFFSGFANLWAAPSVAACSPIALPSQIGKSLDPCPVVDGVRSVMAYIWALGGLFLCFRMIKQVI